MTLKERCQAGEAKLEQVSNALLDLRPEMLDSCEAHLQEVIGLLQDEGGLRREPVDRTDLLSLRQRVRLLALEVQQATNLCLGWAQLGTSQGYTDQGIPALPASEPRSSYEV